MSLQLHSQVENLRFKGYDYVFGFLFSITLPVYLHQSCKAFSIPSVSSSSSFSRRIESISHLTSHRILTTNPYFCAFVNFTVGKEWSYDAENSYKHSLHSENF